MTGRHRIPEPVRPPIDWGFWLAYAQVIGSTIVLAVAVYLIYFADSGAL